MTSYLYSNTMLWQSVTSCLYSNTMLRQPVTSCPNSNTMLQQKSFTTSYSTAASTTLFTNPLFISFTV